MQPYHHSDRSGHSDHSVGHSTDNRHQHILNIDNEHHTRGLHLFCHFLCNRNPLCSPPVTRYLELACGRQANGLFLGSLSARTASSAMRLQWLFCSRTLIPQSSMGCANRVSRVVSDRSYHWVSRKAIKQESSSQQRRLSRLGGRHRLYPPVKRHQYRYAGTITTSLQK